MKRKKLLTLVMACLLTGGMLTSCGKKDLSIGTFDVDETKVDSADILSTYQVTPVTATDNEGTYYVASITVKDPDGNDVTVTNNSFLLEKMGDYTVTYTVTLNDGDVVSKSYTVRVYDVSEPVIECDLDEQNITTLGSTFDLSSITVSDNSGQVITPECEAFFNGDKLELENSILTFDQKGAYQIKVKAQDSSENVAEKTYTVYTFMDFEHGIYFNNEWYATTISNDVAYDGNYSYEFGAFDSAPSWFNDYSMLGEISLYNTEAKYVSFWIYFDFAKSNFKGSVLTNAIYHNLDVYDKYGTKINLNWQNKYEFTHGNWYRFVVSLDDMAMIGDTNDKADAAPVKESLYEIPFYFGVWDNDASSGATKKVYTYLDNIRLLGETDDEVYEEAPDEPTHTYPENCVNDFETDDQLAMFTPSWNSTTSLDEEVHHSGSKSLKFVPYVTYSQLDFGGDLNIKKLDEYEQLKIWIYAKDDATYDDKTQFAIELRYETTTISSKRITSANTWTELTFDLGSYTNKQLNDGKFNFCIFKLANGAAIETGNYTSEALYFDDIYLV